MGFGEGGLNLFFRSEFLVDLTDFGCLDHSDFDRPIAGFAEGRGSVVFLF